MQLARLRAIFMLQRLLPSRSRTDQRGQSLVELAVMGMVLGLILAGVLDLGRAYFAYIAVTDAAAEGAGYGAAFPSAGEEEIKDRVVGSSGGLVSIDRDMVVIDRDTDTITVTVTLSHTLLTPFIQALVEGNTTIPLRQQAVQRILTQ